VVTVRTIPSAVRRSLPTNTPLQHAAGTANGCHSFLPATCALGPTALIVELISTASADPIQDNCSHPAFPALGWRAKNTNDGCASRVGEDPERPRHRAEYLLSFVLGRIKRQVIADGTLPGRQR